jgi:hypothetical protein
VHRHNEGARELPIGWRSSTIAVALRQIRRPAQYRGGERSAREAGLALGVERDVLGP